MKAVKITDPLVDSKELRRAYNAGGSILATWGDRIAQRRAALHGSVSIEMLAQWCDTTPQTIGRIEAGMLNPRDHLRSALARALACEVGDLFAYPTFIELAAEFSPSVAS